MEATEKNTTVIVNQEPNPVKESMESKIKVMNRELHWSLQERVQFMSVLKGILGKKFTDKACQTDFDVQTKRQSKLSVGFSSVCVKPSAPGESKGSEMKVKGDIKNPSISRIKKLIRAKRVKSSHHSVVKKRKGNSNLTNIMEKEETSGDSTVIMQSPSKVTSTEVIAFGMDLYE
jgi:hypothetical protein